VRRRLLSTENYELTRKHFEWVDEPLVVEESRPEWPLVVERFEWGRFYGTPRAFRIDGEVLATEPEAVFQLYRKHAPAVAERLVRRQELETVPTGEINQRMEDSRLSLRKIELRQGKESPQWLQANEHHERVLEDAQQEFADIREQIVELDRANARYEMVLETADGVDKALALDQIVRAYPANRLTFGGRLGVYLSRWWEFVSADPRSSNTEGGVWPAILGTVMMTLIMSVLVVPFGVLAALYLREYAKQGAMVSLVRIAVGNLAGVPSIVFGVFGLGFFCTMLGGSIDQIFFEAKLPTPTYGKGGLLWASLTLALLTLPVVIVATEEALAAVPNSMREGSFATGATRWQTIRRIVLPRAMPGVLTGMILAVARGAGEVAPLMLVGAVGLAPEAPSLLHPDRQFMHLALHIYEMGFKSPNAEAARPFVYTITLLLIAIILMLNAIAIVARGWLRRRYAEGR
jgi:phosphate transport system permease protein